MTTRTFDDKTGQLLDQLEDKLVPAGQNISCHLEGFVHSRFQTYWDYIRLDILLKLQHTCTGFSDEKIFITYHQITELYFKLILSEIEQLANAPQLTSSELILRIKRVNRYLENLVFSFDIMVEGLDHAQFMKFRTALTPASGFQSVQYRLIEICSTAFDNLLAADERDTTEGMPIAQQYPFMYWKKGAIDKVSGRKDLSLINFEIEYDRMLLEKAQDYSHKNLAWRLAELADDEDEHWTEMRSTLRRFDHLMNVEWRLAHFRSAVKHLRTPKETVKATGGTNWQAYLPPRFQRIVFFPTLWSELEMENWGRTFIEQHVFAEA
jgi:tryptophan 2,3-dioxygenase